MVYGSHVRTKKEKRVWEMETDLRQKKMSSADISDADHYLSKQHYYGGYRDEKKAKRSQTCCGEMTVTKIDRHPKQLSPVLSWGQ